MKFDVNIDTEEILHNSTQKELKDLLDSHMESFDIMAYVVGILSNGEGTDMRDLVAEHEAETDRLLWQIPLSILKVFVITADLAFWVVLSYWMLTHQDKFMQIWKWMWR